MPENSWYKVPLNTAFNTSWVEPELRPPYLAGKASPDALIRAWGGFAYDARRKKIILCGGGHANTSDNTIYEFDLDLGEWSFAYLPSDYVTLGTGLYTPICGGFRQPCSSHVYDNNIYLPILNKFCTFGGAQHGDGGELKLYDPDNGYAYLRRAGAYLLDLSQAGQNLVAGGTGDNPKTGAYAGVDLPGANAWQLRDWYGIGQASVFGSSVQSRMGCTAYREEGGFDVVYVVKLSSGAKSLFRVEFHEDPADDVITKVGRAWNGANGELPGGLDYQRNLFVMCNSGTSAAFVFWDLDYASPTNNDNRVLYSNITGDITDYLNDVHNDKMAIDYDQQLGKFVLWGNGGTLYYLTPPPGKPTPTTGWYIEKVEPAGLSVPLTASELSADGGSGVGIFGKWEYAPDLNCFIGLQHSQNGDVWIYKPLAA
ncbi:hypothetical protein [Arsukibacterium indicum]|uniref:Uncharacterized protein n=1 Tax=Arsukibacterium indicum TaxID=2848612 RepID=A0ABS6MGG6_9GAMM|nr:hypothetical protein [Arsukibacterium indicum]MBV2127911.1 hypothetical protein [Arsukibacterium indicum]